MVAGTFLGELGVCLIRSLEHLLHHLVHYGPQPSKSQHNIGGYVLPSPKVIDFFPCSTQLSLKFILLINVKIPTIVGILTFMRRINKTPESSIERKIFIYQHFSCYEQLKFRAQLS